jgi:alpha-glucosidase
LTQGERSHLIERAVSRASIRTSRSPNIPTYSWPLDQSEGAAYNSTAMPAHPLIFSDQYLQISSALPLNTSVYGLGEYYSGNYRRNPSHTIQPFWALDIGDPIDANMYGYHSVYQELRPRKRQPRVKGSPATGTSAVDTHAVWLKTSAGMDVILRDGVIQYRTIGGTLDFYFYSGDTRFEKPTKRAVGFAHHDKADLNTHSSVSAETSGRAFTNTAVTVIEQYVQSIGLPQIPPNWAFGYHQCRWGYLVRRAQGRSWSLMTSSGMSTEHQRATGGGTLNAQSRYTS